MFHWGRDVGHGHTRSPGWKNDAVADPPTTEQLRVLIANERQDRLDAVSDIVTEAGHEVIARLVSSDRAAATREVDPDLAIVATGPNAEHALELIGEIVEEASCPVIVMLEESDPEFLAEAARLGIFGHGTDADAAELQSAIEIGSAVTRRCVASAARSFAVRSSSGRRAC